MAARVALGLAEPVTAAAYLAAALLAVVAARVPAVGSSAFTADVLPYGPPAALALAGWLGWRLNQARLLFTAVAFLAAYGLLAHPDLLRADALALTALALPMALALVLTVPEGRVWGGRGLLRAVLVLAPFAGVAVLLVQAPDHAAWLIGWRLPWAQTTSGIPHAALPALLPLLVAAVALRRDPVAPVLPALLVAWIPFYAAVDAALAPGPFSGGRVAVLFTALAAVMLHAVLRFSWRRAMIDELTGLPNRRALEEAMRDLDRPYAIAMIDLDRFKRFNDRWGHAQGDQTLRYAAGHLRRELGPVVYRYGGEEFCGLFEDTRAPEAGALVERARRRLVAHPFRQRTRRWWWSGPVARGRHAGGRARRFTISAGIASPARPADTPERVRNAADAALYRAKAGGRNRVVVAGRRRT